MNEAYRTLREGHPTRRISAGGFPTDAKRVRAWIDALPRANQALTHRQLAEALEMMRDTRLDGSQRLTVLELLRPVLLETCQSLELQAQGAMIPLPPPKARAMEQLRGFERDLALGYRLAVVELCAPNGNVPFLRGGNVTHAVQRAIYHHSRCLLHAYSLYQTPDPGIWCALHALYRFALSHKLGDKPVVDPAEQGMVSSQQLYAQALLLALSNPYRFSPKEQVELSTVCRDLAPQLKLHSSRPTSDDAFAIPLNEDDGPGYIPEERAEDRGHLLWLDLSALRASLEQPLRDTASGLVVIRFRGGSVVRSTAELLRRLRGGWGTAAERNHQRLSAGHGLDTVVGLTGLHFHLAERRDFDTFMRQTGLNPSANERERHDWAHAGVDAGRIPLFRADVLDQSLGGYRIRWPAEQQIRARVGELIGLAVADDEDSRQWMLGVIRWLRYALDGSVDGGVELLARRARPVGVRSLDPPAEHKPRLRGIQFEAVRGHAEGSLRLVVPSVLETIGGDIEVVRVADGQNVEFDEDMTEQCRNTRVIENAGDYLIVVAERESVSA
jgi:cyclic-di-GMP-binding protein